MFTVNRSNLTQTTIAAMALLALTLAYWTWIWFAPRLEPRLQANAVSAAGRLDSAKELFGIPAGDRSSAAPTGIAVKLLGVAAASGSHRGYAVLQLEPRQILAVRQGDDVAPGIQLAEVHVDHIILVRGGLRETLAWPQKGAAPETVAPQKTK